MPLTAPKHTLATLKLKQRWLALKIDKSYFTVSPDLILQKIVVDDLITLHTQEQETV